jgi:hypothetical protein
MLSEGRLREIEERCQAATEGPWSVNKGESYEGCPFCHVDGWEDHGEEWMNLDLADAMFVANARQDVPDLLAEVRRLRDAWVEERATRIYDIDTTDEDAHWDDLPDEAQEEYRVKARSDARIVFDRGDA